LRGITETYIGEVFSDNLFIELQQRLYALDYFVQIIPNAEKANEAGSEVIIHFTVEERPIVRDVDFEGNDDLRNGKLMEVITTTYDDIISRARIRLDEREIENLYREKGYTQVSVSSRIEDMDSPAEQRVVFVVTEGPQTTIKQIQFSGNAFASDGALRSAMESKQQSLFNSGEFQASVLEQDKNRILDYYYQRGYIQAQVEEMEIATEEQENGDAQIIITVYIDEGKQYTFGGIDFQGNQIFSDQELQELVSHEVGAMVNTQIIQRDYQRITDIYYSNGYIFNRIDISQNIDEETQSVSYTVQIREFDRAHIENIVIRGNSKTADNVILRELPFEVGDVFSAGRIRDGLYNLMNTGYFTNVIPDTPQGSATGLMDIVIDVEEGPTADIRFGVDIGGDQKFPVSANVGWQDSNFRGMGQTLGAEVVASPLEQSLTLSFQEPWMFGKRWSVGTYISFSRTLNSDQLQDLDGDGYPDPYTGEWVYASNGDPYAGTPTSEEISDGTVVRDYTYHGITSIPEEYRMDYEAWEFALGANTGYRFITPVGRLNLSTGISTGLDLYSYDTTQYRPYESFLLDNNNDLQVVNSWKVSMYLDDRDIIVSPTQGYYIGQTFDFTGGLLFGDKNFIKTETTGEVYFKLLDIPVFESWNFKLVLMGRSRFSTILPQFWSSNGENLLASESDDFLEVNGITNARGWSTQEGLRALWENTIELRMPIVEQLIWFDGFFDATYPYDDLGDIGSTSFEDGIYGLGAGIRFSIPQLPISLYLARLFTVDDTGINWQTGDLFNSNAEEGKGLKFVLTLSTSFF
jgi:outer membrane protein insertion porin family